MKVRSKRAAVNIAGMRTVLISALLAMSSGTQSEMDETVVETSVGQVRGFIANDTLVWRGVPYAEPPVGLAAGVKVVIIPPRVFR